MNKINQDKVTESTKYKATESTKSTESLADQHLTLEQHVYSMLELTGEDPNREGLKESPGRYARAVKFLTSGYGMDPRKIIGKALFNEESSELVLVRDIELFSLCEHHLLPFYGKAHVAYIPDKKIIGLSKIPRVVDLFARRLQVQERLTAQISECLMEILKPIGVAVTIEAFHLCMMMRGVQKQGSKTITSSMLGAFRSDTKTRQELLHLLSGISQR